MCIYIYVFNCIARWPINLRLYLYTFPILISPTYNKISKSPKSSICYLLYTKRLYGDTSGKTVKIVTHNKL